MFLNTQYIVTKVFVKMRIILVMYQKSQVLYGILGFMYLGDYLIYNDKATLGHGVNDAMLL